MPARAQPHQISASWATPATGTDQNLPEADVAARRPGEDEEGDHHHVHQDRRGGGEGEAAERVEDAGEERGERDEEDVGEGDAAVGDREGEALVAGEARGHRVDEGGHEDPAEGDEEDEHEGEAGEGVAGEALGVLAGLDLLGEQRHEGEVEGALGEEAAEHVRQGEGDEEGLRHRAGAEEGRHQDVAEEAEDAGDEGPGADAEEGREEADSGLAHGGGTALAVSAFAGEWQIVGGLATSAGRRVRTGAITARGSDVSGDRAAALLRTRAQMVKPLILHDCPSRANPLLGGRNSFRQLGAAAMTARRRDSRVLRLLSAWSFRPKRSLT